MEKASYAPVIQMHSDLLVIANTNDLSGQWAGFLFYLCFFFAEAASN